MGEPYGPTGFNQSDPVLVDVAGVSASKLLALFATPTRASGAYLEGLQLRVAKECTGHYRVSGGKVFSFTLPAQRQP